MHQTRVGQKHLEGAGDRLLHQRQYRQAGRGLTGYFAFGDAEACAALMWRVEYDTRFMKQLIAACAKRAKWFAPDREAAAIRAIVQRVI